MGEYRCSNCGEVYRSDEYRNLDRQPLNPEAEDPMQKGGYEKVCGECDSGFHTDKWQLRETVETDEGEFTVSTVALLIPHGMNHDLWFETLVYPPGGSEWMDRYESQEEAEGGHEEIVNRIEAGEYHFVSTGKRFVLEAEDG